MKVSGNVKSLSIYHGLVTSSVVLDDKGHCWLLPSVHCKIEIDHSMVFSEVS